MEILSGIFHHGLIVPDLELAMNKITEADGTLWSEVRDFDPLPVWTADGQRDVARLKVAYSKSSPLRIELLEAAPGTPYDRLLEVDRAHVGVWVDDVGESVEQLCGLGWRLLVAGGSPRHRHGSMAYLARDGGPVIELVGRELIPMMTAWWATSA